MDETIHALLELDERAKRGDLGDLALDNRANRVLRRDVGPRIGLSLLEAEGDTLFLRVDVENDRLNLLTLLEALRRMARTTRPGDVRHVDHTVDALFELDERTVRREVADLALDAAAHRVAIHDAVPRILLGLADAERDLLVLGVDREDLDHDLVTDVEHVARTGNALRPAEFADMDEALDAGGDLDERTVRGEVDDLALHAAVHRELLGDRRPRILRRLLEAERDALLVLVHVEDHDVELLANLEHFARVLDAAPAHVRDVEETVDPVEVDERAEVRDVLHAALANLALLEGGEQSGLLLGHRALDELATGDDDVLALVGDLDDLEIERLADVGREVTHRGDINLAAGQERLDAVDVHEQAATHHAANRPGDDATFGVLRKDLLPADLIVGGLLGKANHAGLVILELAEHHLELEAGLHFGRIGELVEGDHTLALVTNVDEHVVALDRGDGSLNDGTRLELRVLHRRLLLEELGERRRLLSGHRGFTNSHVTELFCWVCCCSRFSAAPAPFLGARVGSISQFWRFWQYALLK